MSSISTLPTDLFRAWLASRIAARGFSHGQLALRSGIDRSTVGRILNGERRPTLDTAVRLVGALDADAMPHLFVRLGRLGDPAIRVEHAVRDDPHLSDANAAKLLRCYRQLRDSPTPAS